MTLHDCQVYDGGVEELWTNLVMTQQRDDDDDDSDNDSDKDGTPFGTLTEHDVPVDIIVTPTRVYWHLLSPQ